MSWQVRKDISQWLKERDLFVIVKQVLTQSEEQVLKERATVGDCIKTKEASNSNFMGPEKF